MGEPTWQPMQTAPHDGTYIILRWKKADIPIIAQWLTMHDEEGWWLEEGALIKNDKFIGWCSIPRWGD